MKVNGVEIVGNEFAFDGCHKIYIIENEEDKNNALEIGYHIFPIQDLKSCFEYSCPLKFISNWALSKQYVPQFEENVVFE